MRHHQRQIQPRKTVAIVGDGETERIYFSDVRDTDRPKNLAIYPDFPGKIGNYEGVLKRAMELCKEHSRVYALIDMDKVIQDNHQTAYSRLKAEAQAKGIQVLENNPCFEMWLLLHFVRTGRLFANCGEVSDQLTQPNRITNYDKSIKFLTKARLYSTYKEQLKSTAIPNAKFLENRDNQDVLYPRAQTFEFFQWYLNLT